MSEVSVIVPSFRGGKFLREAIASVRAQSLMDWELIIVLDGCDEDLSDIEGVDSRVRVIRQDRRGVSIARNVGISHARSDLIALLDDDDRMLPNRLVAQSREMRDERVAICHTQYRYIDGEGNVLRPGDAKATTYIEFLRNESKILSATAMFRKRTFQEMGGYNSLIPFGEGQDFFQRVSREGEVRFIPEVLYEYRQHESNVWLGGASGYEETAGSCANTFSPLEREKTSSLCEQFVTDCQRFLHVASRGSYERRAARALNIASGASSALCFCLLFSLRSSPLGRLTES